MEEGVPEKVLLFLFLLSFTKIIANKSMSFKARLNYFDLTMIIISMVIGIGIFRNPSIIAQQAGNETIFFSAWIIGAIISMCGALTFAEIGSRFPAAGGYYKTFSYCYHPTLAFMLIWTYLALNAGS